MKYPLVYKITKADEIDFEAESKVEKKVAVVALGLGLAVAMSYLPSDREVQISNFRDQLIKHCPQRVQELNDQKISRFIKKGITVVDYCQSE